VCVRLSLLSVTRSLEPDIRHGLPPISRQLGGHSLPRSAAAKLQIGARQRPCGSADFVCLRAHRYRTMACQDLTPGLAPSQHPCMQPHFTPTSSPSDNENLLFTHNPPTIHTRHCSPLLGRCPSCLEFLPTPWQAFTNGLCCTLLQHTTSPALLPSPTPDQSELVCGACIGTA